MEQTQWAESCRRYEALWRSARLSDETITAWYEEFGVWADYPAAMRALNRLSTEQERAPSLAAWRELHGAMVRERNAQFRASQGTPVPDGPGSAAWERRAKLGDEWMRINDCLHDASFAAMHAALQAQVKKPGEPTDAEAQLVREALMDELRARHAAGNPIERIPRGDPRRPPAGNREQRRAHKGELTRIGE